MTWWSCFFFFHAHEKLALAKSTDAAHAPTAVTANKPANATQRPEAETTDNIGNSMSTLSAKVNSDRATGGVSRLVYIGYLKACGAIVVSVALAISVFAQVSNAKLPLHVETSRGNFVLTPGVREPPRNGVRALATGKGS